MPPPPVPNGTKPSAGRTYYNPFTAPSAPAATSNPPPYGQQVNAPTPPGRPQVAPRPMADTAPATYSSLSDLTKGRSGRVPPGPPAAPSGSARSAENARRMPPPPRAADPLIPPRRNVATVPADGARPTAPSNAGQQSYLSSAGATVSSYIPNSASATVTHVGDKAKDGFDAMFNQQTRDQVVSGAGKAAAGAAKMAGKAAWSLGKFASGAK